ncbi:MAG: C-GCAxxG-C-C family (seleno)protein [Sarcina sp.]
MTKPSEYHKQGYTCGEAIIKSYNDEFGTDMPVEIGSAMGTGFTMGSLCGSIGAAGAIIGIKKGRKSNESENEARKINRQLMSNITKEFNTTMCKELKKNKVSCETIIDYTYENLKTVLAQADKEEN